MTRTRVLSGLVGAGLLAAVAGGQEPKAKDKPKAEVPARLDPVDMQATVHYHVLLDDTKPPAKGSLEEALQQAMQHNPDVRVAEAEAQLAQAKVNQVRAKVAQQVSAARATVEAAKRQVGVATEELQGAKFAAEFAERRAQMYRQLLGKGNGQGAVATELEQNEASASSAKARLEVMKAEAKIEAAKAAVANAEAELTGILGGTPGQPAAAVAVGLRKWRVAQTADTFFEYDGVLNLNTVARVPAAPPGSVADRLRAALDKPVKLDERTQAMEKALLDVLGAAGVAIQVRVPPGEKPTTDPKVTSDQRTWVHLPAAELPLSTWLELIADGAAQHLATRGPGKPKRYEFYLREYGILVADAAQAPADVVSVPQFVKQVRAEKAAKEKAKEAKK